MDLKKKRNVFITGASGFVGANITRTLLKKNFSVHTLNRTKDIPWRLQEVANDISFHKGDLTDIKSLRLALSAAKPDYIIHLATYGAYHFQTEMEKIVQVNIEGTKNLLEASKDIPYKAFINTGSSSEYGYKNKPMKETDSCDPTSYYAATKLGVTHLCKVFANLNKKPVVTFRLFSVYGPFEAPTRLIPAIMKGVLLQNPIELSPGKQRRDFIYVEDVANAYLQAMKLGDKLQGEVCNIGTGKEYTNEEMVKTLFNVANKKTGINKGSYQGRSWDALHWRADMAHTEKVLEWKPIYTIDKGLKTTYSWFEKHINLYQ